MYKSAIFYAKPKDAKRKTDEEEHEYRDKFERDRDRILYSKEFRRLNRKTQVFISGFDDHIRNRLTHTIEVAQISQTISNYLGLNKTLATTIAYGHDVGHTPFGHVGERVLNYFMNGCLYHGDFSKVDIKEKGFKHNWQGVRVVTELEKISNDFEGLNLTDYTIWGILNHTKVDSKNCEFKIKEQGNLCHYNHNKESSECENKNLVLSFYERCDIDSDKIISRYKDDFDRTKSWTIEGLVVRIADEIAQRHHDLEDGLFAGIIDKKEIIDKLNELFEAYLCIDEKEKLKELKEENNLNIFIHTLSSVLVNFLVTQFCINSKNNLEKLQNDFSLRSSKGFNNKKKEIFESKSFKNGIFDIISFQSEFAKKEKRLQDFLKNRILNSHIAQRMDGKSTYILNQLIFAYLNNPQQLPDNTIYLLYLRWKGIDELDKNYKDFKFKRMIGHLREDLKTDHLNSLNEEYRKALMRTICDLIAGMTDDFAIKQYDKLYGTTNVFSND